MIYQDHRDFVFQDCTLVFHGQPSRREPCHPHRLSLGSGTDVKSLTTFSSGPDLSERLRRVLLLLNYADNTMQEFDELLIEHSKKGTYWVHFAVRPKENRRRVMFLQT